MNKRGEGDVAIPTLAFSSLAAFAAEAHMRHLGGNNLDAIRVQARRQVLNYPSQGTVCHSLTVTAFDPVWGCILALHCDLGCLGPDVPDRGERVEAAAEALRVILRQEHRFRCLPGEWVHDPPPGDMAIQTQIHVDEAGAVTLAVEETT